MINLSRRSFFTGAAATLVGLAAPAVIRTAGVLMPIKAEEPPRLWVSFYTPSSGRMAFHHSWRDRSGDERSIVAFTIPKSDKVIPNWNSESGELVIRSTKIVPSLRRYQDRLLRELRYAQSQAA